jgi:hypothetical protein
LGPALKAAFTVMKQIGGKMCVFQSIMPNLGDGALKPREQPGIMGTPNEVKVLRPEVTWYKDTAVEFSRQQISVDMFLFPYQYMDLAALGELPKYSRYDAFLCLVRPTTGRPTVRRAAQQDPYATDYFRGCDENSLHKRNENYQLLR